MVADKRPTAGGIIHVQHLCLVGVMSAPDRPGLVGTIFNELGREHLNAQFIVQSIDLNNDSHVQFCIDENDCARVSVAMQQIAKDLGARKVTVTSPVALISVYGPDFRERPGIAGQAFGALAQVNINILAVSTSISTITCVINGEQAQPAIRAWQDVFGLG
ncbi:MAG: ACT domain-containing protein [Anaerolineae bacterium]